MDQKKEKENKYGTTRANMSNVINKGVNMCCKAVPPNLFTVLRLIFEPITGVEKQKDYLEEFPSISKHYVTVTSNSTFISS